MFIDSRDNSSAVIIIDCSAYGFVERGRFTWSIVQFGLIKKGVKTTVMSDQSMYSIVLKRQIARPRIILISASNYFV